MAGKRTRGIWTITIVLIVFFLVFLADIDFLTVIPLSGSSQEFDVENSSWRGMQTTLFGMYDGGSFDSTFVPLGGQPSITNADNSVKQACGDFAAAQLFFREKVYGASARSSVNGNIINFDSAALSPIYRNCNSVSGAIVNLDWSNSVSRGFSDVFSIKVVAGGSGSVTSEKRFGTVSARFFLYEDGRSVELASFVNGNSNEPNNDALVIDSFTATRSNFWNSFVDPDLVILLGVFVDGGNGKADLSLSNVEIQTLDGNKILLSQTSDSPFGSGVVGVGAIGNLEDVGDNVGIVGDARNIIERLFDFLEALFNNVLGRS